MQPDGTTTVPDVPAKKCTKCGAVKSLDDFHRSSKSRDGRRANCAACGNASLREFNRDYRERTGTHYAYRWKRERECVQCGARWVTARTDARFCSNACQAVYEHGPDRTLKSLKRRQAVRRAAKAARGTHGHRVFIAGRCAKCGTGAVGLRRGGMFFCSDDCRRRERSAIRRAGRGQVNRQAIYLRDGHRCQIPRCLFADRRVAAAEKVPHPKAAVLDHVIPLGEARRLGMTDEEINAPANLRCAHFLCNSSRRELGGNDQLALTG